MLKYTSTMGVTGKEVNNVEYKEINRRGPFTAFSVILTRFLSIKITLYGVEGVRIGFGVLPPLLAGEKEKISYLRIIFAVACTHFTVSLFSVPYFLKILFGIPYQATFLPRLVSFFLNVLTMNLVLLVLQTKINILDIDGVMVKG